MNKNNEGWQEVTETAIAPYRGDRFVDEEGERWVKPYDDMRSYIRANEVHGFFCGGAIQAWIKAGDKFVPNPEWENAKFEAAPYTRESDGHTDIFFCRVKPEDVCSDSITSAATLPPGDVPQMH